MKRPPRSSIPCGKLPGLKLSAYKICPEPIQANIHTLLSVNTIPRGYEAYGILALLEIDQMQGEIIHTLRSLMAGRKLAMDFNNANITALKMLDEDWPKLRGQKNIQWLEAQTLPEQARMQYEPVFYDNRLVHLYERCVIVDSPQAQVLKRYHAPGAPAPAA